MLQANTRLRTIHQEFMLLKGAQNIASESMLETNYCFYSNGVFSLDLKQKGLKKKKDD